MSKTIETQIDLDNELDKLQHVDLISRRQEKPSSRMVDITHQELNFNGRKESEMKTNNKLMKDSKKEPIYNYMKLDVDKRTN